MSPAVLNAEDLRAALLAVADTMVDSVDILTEADKMGDADHGTGMKRGFSAVRDALTALPATTSVEKLLSTTGTTLMAAVGGASGAIFGTFFRAWGKRVADDSGLTAAGFADGLAAGLTDVQKRGNAKPGDKTMIDALAPAVETVRIAVDSGEGIARCLVVAAEAAEEGKEHTRQMVATTGKAKTLGERTIGHVDPGALSMSIIFRTLAEQISPRTP